MAEKKAPYDWILTGDAAAATHDLKSDRCPSGEIWCVQNATTENLDNAPSTIRLMKGGAGVEFPLDEDTSPAEDTLSVFPHNFFLTPGQFILARFTGCTAGDRLRAYATGYKEKREG